MRVYKLEQAAAALVELRACRSGWGDLLLAEVDALYDVLPDGNGSFDESPWFGAPETVMRCGVCNRRLDVPSDPDSLDCGGDCRYCVREAEVD